MCVLPVAAQSTIQQRPSGRAGTGSGSETSSNRETPGERAGRLGQGLKHCPTERARGEGRAPGSASETSCNRETPGERAGRPGQGLKVGPQASSLSVTWELYAGASGGQRPSAQSPWCPRAAPVGQPSAGICWRPHTQGRVWCMGSVTSLGSLCVWLPVCLPLEREPHGGALTVRLIDVPGHLRQCPWQSWSQQMSLYFVFMGRGALNFPSVNFIKVMHVHGLSSQLHEVLIEPEHSAGLPRPPTRAHRLAVQPGDHCVFTVCASALVTGVAGPPLAPVVTEQDPVGPSQNRLCTLAPVFCLHFVCRKALKNKFNQKSQKMQKQRETVKMK